jgi:hypothetical protein
MSPADLADDLARILPLYDRDARCAWTLARLVSVHRAAILSALRAEPSEQEVERAAEAMFAATKGPTHGNWDELGADQKTLFRAMTLAALRAARRRP